MNLEKFWSLVDKNGPTVREELGPCWLWTRGKTKGYGLFRIGKRRVYAHRWLFEQVNGSLDSTKKVCHHCDIPACVRPDHLYQGTQQNNMQDAVERGRHRNQNTDKTICKYGHPLAGENLMLTKKGRECRICHRRHWREWYERSRN